jgi:hypothetical protein
LLAIGLLSLGAMVLADRLTTRSSSPETSASGSTPPAASVVDQGIAIARPPATPPPATVPPATAPPAMPPRPIARPLPRPGVGGGGPTTIALEFRLDPALTKSLQMGDRWISPPTYTRMGGLKGVTVEARARKLGAKPPRGKPTWTTTEPDMVEVSPDEGDEVKITVWREGESQLTVNSGGASKTLLVKATPVGGALRVDITQ